MKNEGYIYISYGKLAFLKYVIASVESLKRYDNARPVAIVCSKEHIAFINEYNVGHLFDDIVELKVEHTSIVGFKHNLFNYHIYERNLFLDSDIIWLKNPDYLWSMLSGREFTITGIESSDHFFGGPKHAGILFDIILQKRRITLKRFGLTYLSRVQSGMIYSGNRDRCETICKKAADFITQKSKTHFHSRKKESGRTEESCEWSLAMAMAYYNVTIFPWFMGEFSPQIDYVKDYTQHNEDFTEVKCLLYSSYFIYSFRGLKMKWLRKGLFGLFAFITGRNDFRWITPFSLHFGWIHQKQPFINYSERIWIKLASNPEINSDGDF